MSLTRRRTASAPARGGDTGGRRGIPVPMADGTILPTDHYHPSRHGPAPTVLVRSPVGRIPMGLIYGQYFAHRGFHVIVQETRDVAHGYSVQDPASEREDGLSTVAWMRNQPWFRRHLRHVRGRRHRLRAMGPGPRRARVQGHVHADLRLLPRRRRLPWTSARPWYLHADGSLRSAPPTHGEPRRYRYDPADPTPVPRGPVIFGDSRPEDCRPLEKRADVLTYTSDPLPAPMELIGPVTADIHLRSSRTHTDCGVRICDVHPDGTSMNVCEGIRRVSPGAGGLRDADRVTKVSVELWPTAHRFPAGHRLRVHLCSGGHPRVARHTGSTALLDTSGILLAAEQEIFHDATRHSVIHLPVSLPPTDGVPSRPGAPGEDEGETEPGEWAPDFLRPGPGTW
ncbi:CocE/NonD family hydrolase [Streptomyces roseoverticillatus]|uniref:CocE/NonD family hydrolase n=1 Tax=Streptomyces roseoverticillatus TaxID=66429 RepID=UPI0033CD1A7B